MGKRFHETELLVLYLYKTIINFVPTTRINPELKNKKRSGKKTTETARQGLRGLKNQMDKNETKEITLAKTEIMYPKNVRA